MSRFVVDVGVVLRLLADGTEIPDEHELLAPTLVRSQVLAELYAAARRGEIENDVARERLEHLSKLNIRLLGDAVLRRVAWKVAEQLDMETTYVAEYVALTQLQADALVTMDGELAKTLEGIVETVDIGALR